MSSHGKSPRPLQARKRWSGATIVIWIATSLASMLFMSVIAGGYMDAEQLATDRMHLERTKAADRWSQLAIAGARPDSATATALAELRTRLRMGSTKSRSSPYFSSSATLVEGLWVASHLNPFASTASQTPRSSAEEEELRQARADVELALRAAAQEFISRSRTERTILVCAGLVMTSLAVGLAWRSRKRPQ